MFVTSRASLYMGTCGRRFRLAFFIKSSVFREIVVYQELFCVVMLLPSSSKQNEDDGKKKIKKGIGFTSKTKTLSEQHSYMRCQTWSEYGNAMVAVIPKIVLSSTAIVTTSILSAIPSTESDFTDEKILSFWLCLVLPEHQLLWIRCEQGSYRLLKLCLQPAFFS